MIKQVLVATDGSKSSLKAAAFAARLLAGSRCTLTLLTVFEEPVYPVLQDEITPPLGTIAPYEDLREVFLDQAEKVLDKTQEYLGDSGMIVERKVRFGAPAHEILSEISEGGHEMVILGSYGHSTLGEVILGSVSYRISHHADCPVLIVR